MRKWTSVVVEELCVRSLTRACCPLVAIIGESFWAHAPVTPISVLTSPFHSTEVFFLIVRFFAFVNVCEGRARQKDKVFRENQSERHRAGFFCKWNKHFCIRVQEQPCESFVVDKRSSDSSSLWRERLLRAAICTRGRQERLRGSCQSTWSYNVWTMRK